MNKIRQFMHIIDFFIFPAPPLLPGYAREKRRLVDAKNVSQYNTGKPHVIVTSSADSRSRNLFGV